MARKPLVPPRIANSMKQRGMSEADIARAMGVSRQAVNLALRKVPNRYQTPNETVRELFPWTVPHRF